MNKLQPIHIPEGIFYLGNYPELLNLLPTQTFIFNKVMTGCGATTMFLDDAVPTVLCSPRKELIYCKANSDRYIGKVHLFGSTSEDVLEKINAAKNYILSLRPTPFFTPTYAPKILVTYDSTKYVIQTLRELGLLERFRFVVDEFQTLMTDASFRGDAEAEFMENLRTASYIIFLSATPYIEEYLDMLDEFKDLPYLELSWPESSIHPINITPSLYDNGSPTRTIQNIIDHYKSQGFFEEMMDRYGNVLRSTEAVFFVNDVKFIVETIKKNSLPLSEVNIICSDRKENHAAMRRAGLTVGHAPKEGERHPTYTFVTKAAYEGTDFYSPCAYTYIFSNIKRENLAIDISLDLPQILGRQRLSTNAFRYSATLFYKSKPDFSDSEKKEFMEGINTKVNETEELLNVFNSLQNPDQKKRMARKYRGSQMQEKYQNDYTTVVDDKVSDEVRVVFNKYVMANELRAWDVQMHQYQDITYVMASVCDAFATTSTSSFVESKQFLSTFSGNFEQKMRMYAEFLDSHPECKEDLQMSVMISNDIKTYYNNLGSDRLRSLSWKEANIVRELYGSSASEDRIAELIYAEFPDGWYSLTELKEKLQGIYDSIGLRRIAKATDIGKYYTYTKKQKSIGGNRSNGFDIHRA